MLPPNGTLHIKQQKIYTKEKKKIRKYIYINKETATEVDHFGSLVGWQIIIIIMTNNSNVFCSPLTPHIEIIAFYTTRLYISYIVCTL